MRKYITLFILIAAGIVLTACNDDNVPAKEVSQSLQKDQAEASAVQPKEQEEQRDILSDTANEEAQSVEKSVANGEIRSDTANEKAQSVENEQSVEKTVADIDDKAEEERETKTTKKLLGGADVYFEEEPQAEEPQAEEPQNDKKYGKFGRPPM